MSGEKREVREAVQITQPLRAEIDMHCPICGKPVKKVTEMTEGECNVQSDCSNEYWTHKGNKLIKIINPVTPTDGDMEKYGAKK